MKIFVYLIVFAVEAEDRKTFVLLENRDILSREMSENSPPSFSIIENMMKDSMGITGRWLEATPRLIGVLDDEWMKDVETQRRSMAIVYSLYIPSKNAVKENYSWVYINDIEKVCNNDISKNIIRYSATYI